MSARRLGRGFPPHKLTAMKAKLIFALSALLALCPALSLRAQVAGEGNAARPVESGSPAASADTLPGASSAGAADAVWDDVPLTAPMYDIASPALPGPFGGWRLHEGLNAQVGLSVTAGIGKGAPRGVGFGQTAAFAYVLPLSKKVSFAAGVYARNMDWGAYRSTDVGIAGTLAYRPSDRVSLYLYGTKSFMPRGDRGRYGYFGEPWYDNFKDRIGAAAEFKIGDNASIGVSLEYGHSDAPRMPSAPARPSFQGKTADRP